MPLRRPSPRLILTRLAFTAALLFSSCGGDPPPVSAAVEAEIAEARLTTRGTLAPQSFIHDTVSDDRPEVAWEIRGAAGDIIAPDVWPTPSTARPNRLAPTIALLGPPKNGKRAVIARGEPRNEDDRHQAIDGFRLPKSGSYLVVVAQKARGQGGELTLRFWTSASHAPRPEKAQLDLALRTSQPMQDTLASRRAGGTRAGQPWTDDQVDAAVGLFFGEPSLLIAFSDAEQLLLAIELAISDHLATQAQLERVREAAATLVGRPAQFATLTPQQQAFAVYWLGDLTRALFEAQVVAKGSVSASLTNLHAQLDALLAAWPGARESHGERHVRALSLAGAVYGYVAEWSSSIDDRDGTPVFMWWSTDYFDKGGHWLGEQSAGASEPEDD